MALTVDPNIKPGFYSGIPNESYHSGPGVSKSGLWTIHTSTPAHFRFHPKRERKEHFEFGEAAHIAILQPDEFENLVARGPEDRRGNRWKESLEYANAAGKVLLTSGDFDNCLAVRDAVTADPLINTIVGSGERIVESSGYWIDEETGVLCRFRPDLYRPDMSVILDVKSTACAAPADFAKSVCNYGYHSQEAFYCDGMAALKTDVDAFVFLAWEKESPYAKAIYELPPSIVEEGRMIMRDALRKYAECAKTNSWPAYPDGVSELKIPKWAYKFVGNPDDIDNQPSELEEMPADA